MGAWLSKAPLAEPQTHLEAPLQCNACGEQAHQDHQLRGLVVGTGQSRGPVYACEHPTPCLQRAKIRGLGMWEPAHA
jgi:hypothetical protein